MRAIGIDPGYDRLGIAVIEKVNQRDTLLYSTCVETDRTKPIPDRIQVAGDVFVEILKEYTPEAVGIEKIFFNKNQKTATAVAEARGVMIYLAKKHGCAVCEFSPQEIKIATTGYGKSDKRAVIDMVQRLVIGAPKDALDDEYDAIAVGITCLAHHR